MDCTENGERSHFVFGISELFMVESRKRKSVRTKRSNWNEMRR